MVEIRDVAFEVGRKQGREQNDYLVKLHELEVAREQEESENLTKENRRLRKLLRHHGVNPKAKIKPSKKPATTAELARNIEI